ncbi:MAG: 4-(cytidine 5'-diphospho)-2-C-methyl-D-erythritol kinase [Gemmatimonadota bacterium]
MSQASLTMEAPAKINLWLSVLAREASGYHQIETVFHALDLADELSVTLADRGFQLRVEGGDVGPSDDNLVTRATRVFQQRCGVPGGVQFRLVKRIPAGAGLGGGSSDAAAALLALNTLCHVPLVRDELIALGATIGSDVPFFLCGSAHALAWGRGQRLLPLPPLPQRPVLLVVPPFASPTAEAYRRLSDVATRPAPAGALSHAALLRWDDVAASAGNDFERVVLPEHPPLMAVRDALKADGAAPALLTGSGSAVFGVFHDDVSRERAAADIGRDWPDFQLVHTRTAGDS